MNTEFTYKSPPLIKGQNFSIEEIENAKKEGRILMISPNTIGLCNFNCVYCFTDDKMCVNKHKRQLSFNEYGDILIQAKELGAKTMRIAGWGEPFLDPIFFEKEKKRFPLIEFANSIGLYAIFFTNGSFITNEIAKRLFDLEVTVIAKKNSFKEDVQNKISGNQDAFNLMNNGLDALIKVGLNNSTVSRLAIESMLTKLNYQEIESMFIWLRDRNIVPTFQLIMHGGKGKQTEHQLSKIEAKELFYRLLEIDRCKYGYNWIPSPPYVGYTCDKLYYNAVVDPYGNVQPCYAIDIYVGNILEKPLKELLKNDIFRKTRSIEKFISSPCKECKISGCYYGCRCDTYQKGDLFGKYEMCWHGN